MAPLIARRKRSKVLPGGALKARDIRDDAAVVADFCVPIGKRRVELGELMTTLREPDGLRRVEGDAVLVPREIPGDRDHGLLVRAGERDDAGPRAAEALRDSAHRSPKARRVEQVGSLYDCELVTREPAQNRPVGNGRRLLGG